MARYSRHTIRNTSIRRHNKTRQNQQHIPILKQYYQWKLGRASERIKLEDLMKEKAEPTKNR